MSGLCSKSGEKCGLAGQELLVVPAESWGVIDFYLNWSAGTTGEVAIIYHISEGEDWTEDVNRWL